MRPFSIAYLLLAAGFALAQETPAPTAEPTPAEMEAAYQAHVEKSLSGIRYQEGTPDLPGGMARLELPPGFRYLNPTDAKKVVVDLWGNPPGSASDILGMVVPAGEELSAPDSWAIVLSFEEDGYVSDKDADDIDYDDLLKQLKEGSEESNKARKASGYDTMDLTGWAVTPRYDKQNKVLYWAKRFDIPDSDQDTLNYDVRVLGRRGVLSLNGVASMTRVSDVESASPAIVSMVHFNDGQRYADYNASTDKKADYSLAGLVLGGAVAAKVAAKVGLLAKLGGVLLALKKFVILIVIGIAAGLKKLFGRKGEA